jgi:hypothetical protein
MTMEQMKPRSSMLTTTTWARNEPLANRALLVADRTTLGRNSSQDTNPHRKARIPIMT